ncbi:MAG: DUF362 domain-containing protein, partial [Candidatus Hodarchaeota archaeon]
MDERSCFEGIIHEVKYSMCTLRSNTPQEVEKHVSNVIDSLNWKNIITSDMKVLIKPNFTKEIHEPGVTTSPIVLKALVKYISGWGNEITIIEGNGGSWSFDATQSAFNHGVKELKEEFGVKWVNISNLPRTKYSSKIIKKNLTLELPKDIDKIGDILISLPVFKTHCITKVTLGIKNLWGLIPSEMRMLNHSKLKWYLPLLGNYFNHQLTLIDGTIGLEGNGPMRGDKIEMNTIFGSNDPVIADIIGALLMKIDPRAVDHIVHYAKHMDIEIDTIISKVLEDISDFQVEFNMKRNFSNYLDLITFKSRFISKIVFDSPLTSIIYFLFNLINGS